MLPASIFQAFAETGNSYQLRFTLRNTALLLEALICWLKPDVQAMVFSQEIAKEIMEQQTPKQVHIIRGKLYELLVNCLPPEVIIRKLAQELMSKLDDQLKYQTAHWAAFYEHRLQVVQLS